MKTEEEYYQDIQALLDNEWYRAAICAYEQFLQTHTTFAPAYHDLGTLYFEFGDKERVLECYKRAADYDPTNINYLRSLANYYYAELQQVEPALTIFNKIIDMGTHDAETYFIAANLCVALRQFEDATKNYQQVLEIEPRHSAARECLTKINSHQSSQGQAVSAEVIYQQSQQASASGNIESAVSILEKLLDQYPDFALAHNDLGVYYQKSGNNDQAGIHYHHAVRLSPEKSTFKKNLADFCYMIKGDVGAALKIYLDVLKSNPEDTEVLLAAGKISQAVNRPQDAGIFYQRALEIEPWNQAIIEDMTKLLQDPAGKAAAGF